ncbi:MAG: aldehyde dehydrogenase family protein, partial [Myxococcota bacterium]
MDHPSSPSTPPTRLPVWKTYKLYIGGRFPRTESGRYLKIHDHQGAFVADVCRASRKDLRNAVLAARAAQPAWASRVAFNRGQILYRMAEMLEARRHGFQERLVAIAGYTAEAATAELNAAIDRLVWYAGWADKYIQLFGTTNPVASPHFNFTLPESTGVVTILGPRNAPVLGPISALAPIILSGNTAILVVDGPAPQLAIELGEVLATSDLPDGVINIL